MPDSSLKLSLHESTKPRFQSRVEHRIIITLSFTRISSENCRMIQDVINSVFSRFVLCCWGYPLQLFKKRSNNQTGDDLTDRDDGDHVHKNKNKDRSNFDDSINDEKNVALRLAYQKTLNMLDDNLVLHRPGSETVYKDGGTSGRLTSFEIHMSEKKPQDLVARETWKGREGVKSTLS